MSMVKWVITATTIYCDAVDDEATLMVYKDGMAKCTGYKKYGKPDKEAAKLLKIKSRRSGKQLGCTGPECHRLTQYRDRLMAEDEEKRRS